MPRIGYVYEETRFDGGYGRLVVWNCPSRADADAAALRMGWTPPRWWQWWRWRDHPRGVCAEPEGASTKQEGQDQ